MRNVVVVGSGIAGLSAALRASRLHRVTLVSKGELIGGCTRFAQGGIAAALSADDSVDTHIADTLLAGAGHCSPEAVAVLCGDGPDRVRELIELGVPFDRDGAELARGREAAHSVRRVLHADGDATGLAIQTALVRAVREAPMRILKNAFLDDVLLDAGRVAGVGLLTDRGPEVVFADAVVLATGGAGQLYRHTTNPAGATGDGIAAAWRAGARLRDLEFTQFHPTALAVPGSPLISEAVRGEGAHLLDAAGRRFMTDAHPDAELAPRDVVARAMATAMARQGGDPVLLDARHLGGAYLERRFPSISRTLAALGFDWAREPIPVTPAAHYWMGGIATDLRGRTSVPGLYAAGEAACTGAHGANRLASNSLLEGSVFGARVADDLDAGTEAERLERVPPTPMAARRADPAAARNSIPREEIQAIMWNEVGLYRSRDGLERARAELRGRGVTGESPEDRETANLLELARLTTDAALAREESRGAHFRIDAPLGSSPSGRSEREMESTTIGGAAC